MKRSSVKLVDIVVGLMRVELAEFINRTYILQLDPQPRLSMFTSLPIEYASSNTL